VRLERIVELEQSRGALGAVLGRREEETGLFVRPYGVAWEGDDLLVADPGARRLVRIGADGRVELSGDGAAGAPVFLASCPQGIVASDSQGGRVALLARHLSRERWIATDLERPTGIACVDTDVYVVETGRHRIVAIDSDGRHRAIGERGAGPGEFNFPTALAVVDTSLLLGDTLNFRVQRLDASTGDFQGEFGQIGDAPGEMPRIKGIAVDAAGQIWVSDAHTDRISIYDAQGMLLLSLGGRGSDPGRFSFPAGIAAHPDGRVAVVDSFNRRIQVFRVLDRVGDQ
jgi:DNA-binding beta-propeller fold protein YncE